MDVGKREAPRTIWSMVISAKKAAAPVIGTIFMTTDDAVCADELSAVDAIGAQLRDDPINSGLRPMAYCGGGINK